MIRKFPGEVFKEIDIPDPLRFRYAVSNRGRIMSFSETMDDGKLLLGATMHGYKMIRYKVWSNGKASTRQLFVYKLVAQLFIPKTSDDQQFVLHLDHERGNDHVNNLRWATYEEKRAHYESNPKVQKGRLRTWESKRKADGAKLTSTNVIHLKKILQDPNRKTRMKILAKQFGVSEMQISRIKSGENWGHIKV